MRRNLLDYFCDLCARCRLIAGPNFGEIVRVRKNPRRKHAVDHGDRDLKAQVLRQNPTFFHHREHEIRTDRVARETEPPSRIAEANLLHASLDLEPPGIGGIARMLTLDAVLVRRRPLHHFELGMGCEHLIVHAADPMPPRSHLTIRHGEKIAPERHAERLEHLLRRVERNAADQNELVRHTSLHLLLGMDERRYSAAAIIQGR
jgi:hypothetical protein